ncbi:unnamed protein product [Laminaria digitata]
MAYQNLDVYQKSYSLALEIHKLSLKFPAIEQREIGGQIRRSSKSIPANIAEGMGKQESRADVRKYIRIAIGSNDETMVWLRFSRDLGYLNTQISKQYLERYNEVGKMLRGVLKRYS